MNCRQQNAIIIIPDVHGCSFWREPSEKYRQADFVFLGDYLDPYPEDNIRDDDAFQGLVDIVAFKKAYPDRVTLLWGNHDLHYFSKQFSLGTGMIKRMRSGTGLSSNKIKNVSRLRLKGRSMEDAIFSPMQV